MPEKEFNLEQLRYESYMGLGPSRIAHWEHWSDPDAATHITGIDYYTRPRSCMQQLNRMYPFVDLPVPAEDDPLPRIDSQTARFTAMLLLPTPPLPLKTRNLCDMFSIVCFPSILLATHLIISSTACHNRTT